VLDTDRKGLPWSIPKMEETVGPVSTCGRELLEGRWRPIGLMVSFMIFTATVRNILDWPSYIHRPQCRHEFSSFLGCICIPAENLSKSVVCLWGWNNWRTDEWVLAKFCILGVYVRFARLFQAWLEADTTNVQHTRRWESVMCAHWAQPAHKSNICQTETVHNLRCTGS
jgi:hypothetical protein